MVNARGDRGPARQRCALSKSHGSKMNGEDNWYMLLAPDIWKDGVMSLVSFFVVVYLLKKTGSPPSPSQKTLVIRLLATNSNKASPSIGPVFSLGLSCLTYLCLLSFYIMMSLRFLAVISYCSTEISLPLSPHLALKTPLAQQAWAGTGKPRTDSCIYSRQLSQIGHSLFPLHLPFHSQFILTKHHGEAGALSGTIQGSAVAQPLGAGRVRVWGIWGGGGRESKQEV